MPSAGGGVGQVDDAGDHRRLDPAGEGLPVDVEAQVGAGDAMVAMVARAPWLLAGSAQGGGDGGDEPLAAEVQVEPGVERLLARVGEVEAEVELVRHEGRPFRRAAQLRPSTRTARRLARGRKGLLARRKGRERQGDQGAVLGKGVEADHPRRPGAGEGRQRVPRQRLGEVRAQGEEVRGRGDEEAVRPVGGVQRVGGVERLPAGDGEPVAVELQEAWLRRENGGAPSPSPAG